MSKMAHRLKKEIERVAGPETLAPLGSYFVLTDEGARHLALNSYASLGANSEIRIGILELLSQAPIQVRQILVKFEEENELFEDYEEDRKQAMVGRFLRILKRLEKDELIRRENYRERP